MLNIHWKDWCGSWSSASYAEPPDVKSWLIGKDPDSGKDWRQKEKGAIEDETVEKHTDSMDMSFSKFWETVKDKKAWHAAVHEVTQSNTT